VLTSYLDISVQRNANFARQVTFAAPDGTPIDLTGVIYALDVKHSAGAVESPLGSGLANAVGDPANGVLLIEFDGADFAAVEGSQETVRLAYDLIAIQDGKRFCLLRGAFILEPGVS
jgi:hypothetical protein